jgi:exodeoxyribonuclease X
VTRIIRVIDFETCGFPPDNAQIVEVATVDLVPALAGTRTDGSALLLWRRGRVWQSLVQPMRDIPPEASAIHHITNDMVFGCPEFHTLLPHILDGDPVFCAHNSRFEIECAKLNEHVPVSAKPFDPSEPLVPAALPLSARPMLCTYKGAVTAWPDAPAHGNQVMRYWLGLKLQPPDELPELYAPHRALGDAVVTAAIARRILAIPACTIEDWLALSSGPILLPRLTFGEHAMKPIAEVPTSYFDWIVNKSKGPWDPDVMYTAQTQLAERRAASRSRSPV